MDAAITFERNFWFVLFSFSVGKRDLMHVRMMSPRLVSLCSLHRLIWDNIFIQTGLLLRQNFLETKKYHKS